VLLVRHVLPNAAPNIIAATVLGARGALSSLAIVDLVYVWGGAGLVFVQALGSRRLVLATELAMTFAVASVLLALAANLVRARVRVAA
jgi:ABC-type dipeptide/oligopeptide/nickel transport system permease component